MSTALLLLGSYLVGSVNVAIVVLRVAHKPDPRGQHSGNPGASNVARIAGRPIAGLVLGLDLARSIFVCMLASRRGPLEMVPWAGLALLVGNRFPLFHGFRGGKGVATYLGFVGAARPWLALAACAAWLAAYFLGKVVAVASMVMLAVLVCAAWFAWPATPAALLPTGLSAALIVHGHRGNWATLRKRQSG